MCSFAAKISCAQPRMHREHLLGVCACTTVLRRNNLKLGGGMGAKGGAKNSAHAHRRSSGMKVSPSPAGKASHPLSILACHPADGNPEVVYGASYEYAVESEPFAFYAQNTTPITIAALSGSFYPISLYLAGKPYWVRATLCRLVFRV